MMKITQLSLFTASIIMLVGVFLPMYTVVASMDIPAFLGGEGSQISKTMSISLFQMITTMSDRVFGISNPYQIILSGFSILSIIVPLLFSIIALVRKYEWLLPCATVYLIFCASFLYILSLKFKYDSMVQVQFGFSWACFLIPSSLILLFSIYKLIKK